MYPDIQNTHATPSSRVSLGLLCSVFAVVAFLFLGDSSWSQQEPPGDPRAHFETRVFEPRHIEVKTLQGTLSLLNIQYRAEADLNTIVAHAPPGKLDAFAEIFRALDQPRAATATLAVNVFVLEAATEPLQNSSSTAPPSQLESVLGQLKELFGYQHFGVLDSVMLTVADGARGGAEGGYEQGYHQAYAMGFRAKVVASDPDATVERRTIRIEGLEFHTSRPDIAREQRDVLVGLQTNVEVLDGQTAVIGKASPVHSNAAVVLVLRVDIQD